MLKTYPKDGVCYDYILLKSNKEKSIKSCVCHDCRNFKLCRTHFPKRSCMSWLSRPRFLSAAQLTQVCADLSESECYATNAPCSRATCYMLYARVAEVAREHGWHPPKSLDSDENFKPEHPLLCRKLRFVAIYALFLEIFGHKKSLFG